MSKSSRFEAPNSHEHSLLAPKEVFRWPKVTRFGPEGSIWVVNTGAMHFGPYILNFWDFLGFQNGSICSYNGHLGAHRGATKVQKLVNDAHPVNIERLGHYVVFVNKSGALRDFQRGKTRLLGLKKNPLDQR